MSQADRDKQECGCWWESTNGMAFTFDKPKAMPERSAFTDNAIALYHYCEKHWQERGGDVSG